MQSGLSVALLLLIVGVWASSHSEAPNTVALPQADGTDLYAFRSYETGRSNFVVIMANFLPLQSPFGGPNYFSLSDQHVYEIIIDNNGDGNEDITFQFVYGNRLGGPVNLVNYTIEGICDDTPYTTVQSVNTGIALNIGGKNMAIPLKIAGPVTTGNTANLNWFEFYSINYITGDRNNPGTQINQLGTSNTVFTKPMDYAGTKSFPNYAAYANQFIYNISIPGCSTAGRVFVGQRKEPFQINLGGIFDLINFIPIPGFPGAIQNSPGNNALSDKNIATFALEVPIACLVGSGNGVIGVWQSTRQINDTGTAHTIVKQVQRMANPLVNEILIGLINKGDYNRGTPAVDSVVTLPYVQYPTMPTIISSLFLNAVNQQLGLSLTTLAPNNYPRQDLVLIFLQGIPGINQLANTALYADYLRLNTSVQPTAPSSQNNLGVIGGDLAGFPNGRRPADDVVDIGLDALMGRLCWLNITCTAANAPVGNVNFTDGVSPSVYDYDLTFPFFKTPIPGYTGTTASPVATITPFICPPSTAPAQLASSYLLPLTVFALLASLLLFVAAR